VVLANSAIALQTANRNLSLPEAVDRAREALASGKALQVFKTLISPKVSISVV
jgi:anthranilate phosphoribosyltransferase